MIFYGFWSEWLYCSIEIQYGFDFRHSTTLKKRGDNQKKQRHNIFQNKQRQFITKMLRNDFVCQFYLFSVLLLSVKCLYFQYCKSSHHI